METATKRAMGLGLVFGAVFATPGLAEEADAVTTPSPPSSRGG
jgi:hypothetical protein